MPLLNRLPHIAALSAFFLFVGCNAPEEEAVKTSLKFVSPLKNQVNSQPVINSADTKMVLSYTLSSGSLVKQDNIYAGTARFKLLVNGVDVTDRQRKADCSMPVKFKGGGQSIALHSDDPEACYDDLMQQLKGRSIASNGVAYDSGFKVSTLGPGGQITFQDLQSIQSTFVPGENIITLRTLKESYEEASVVFNYTAQPVHVAVSHVTFNNNSSSRTAGDGYDVVLEIKSKTGIKRGKYNDGLGRHEYEIKFIDANNNTIGNDQITFSSDGRVIEIKGLTYPDLSTSVAEKPELSYELTDELGNKQNKGFVFSGQKLDRFFALQLNGSFFGAFKKPVDSMIDTIVDEFVSLFPLAAPLIGIEKAPGEGDRITDLKPGESIITVFPPFSKDVKGLMKAACKSFLNKTDVDIENRRCAFYAEIVPPDQPVKTNLGFSKDGNNSEFVFDIIFDELNIKIDIAAYEYLGASIEKPGKDLGRYLGSFKTIISFNDLVLRDTFTVDKSIDNLISGINNRNGYVMRYGNQVQQRIGELLSESDSTFRPKLVNPSCPGDICLVDAGIVKFLGDIPMVSEELVLTIEDALNQFLPDITESLLNGFPDVGGIRKSIVDNAPEQVVKSSDAGDIVRNMSANDVTVEDVNPFTALNPFQSIFNDVGRNWAGRLLFSGGYKPETAPCEDDDEDKDGVQCKGLLTPFVAAESFNHFQWGHKTKVNGVDKQIDAVASLNLNALNQYIAADFKINQLEDWLTETFTVNSSSTDRKTEALSKMVRSFDQIIDENDEVKLDFSFNRAPELVFTGEKVSKYEISYSFLGGLITGGSSDSQVTPAIKIYFNDVDVSLTKRNNLSDDEEGEDIFKVNTDFAIEVNIGFENGLPKLYVKTPQAPQALYEDEPAKRLDKQLIIDVNRVDYLKQDEVEGTDLASKVVEGAPVDPNDLHLKVKISNAFSGVYRQLIEEYYSEGMEHFFDDLVVEFLRDNFSKKIDFREYSDRVKLINFEKYPQLIGQIPEGLTYFSLTELYSANPVLVEGNMRWFTIDQAGAWLNMGLDFTSRELADDESCPEPLGPLAMCFTDKD